METRDLRLFLHLSNTLHFASTSSACYVSPSTLTRIIQKLEQEVGEPLFDRDNRTVRLTPAGELFRDYARSVLEQWSIFQGRLQQRSDSLQGRLSIFCSVTASYSFLHELLDRFRGRYPGVEIQLHTGDSALTIQRILDGDEDVGIAARPDRLPGKLHFKAISESPLVFIAPATQCPLRAILERAGGGSLPEGRATHWLPSDIPWQQVPLILSETGLARTRSDRWFREQGISPDIYAQVTGNEAIVSMVSLGFGLGIVPQLVVENSPLRNKIMILAVEPELEPFSIGLCVLRRRLSSPLIRAFWDLSQEALASRDP